MNDKGIVMTDQQITTLINALRYADMITPLQKDILDTWDALQKKPFDAEVAHKQIVSNNVHYTELFVAISAMPGVIQKSFDRVTQEDMIFNLQCQLDGLAAKEIETIINGDRT